MSYQSNGVDLTRIAAADLSAAQFLAVAIDGDGKAAVASAAGQAVLGILQTNPIAGVAASVRVGGVSKAIAGAAINAGDQVATDASGKMKVAVKATTNTSDGGAASDALAGSYVLGIALEDAGADGDVFPVLITHSGAQATTAA